MATTAIALSLGLLGGLTLGTFGGGGSVLVVPTLVYGLSVPPVQATALSQIVVGASSAAAASVRWHAGSVSVGAAVALSIVGAPAAYLGRLACRAASDTLIMATLAIVLLGASILLFVKRLPEAVEEGPRNAAPGRFLALIALTGVLVGFVTGFLGVGGGFLMVPALVVILAMPMRRAIGTSLTVIAVACTSGLLAGGVSDAPWDIGGPFVVGAIVGGVVASRFAHVASTLWLQRGFAVLLLVVGVLILAENARASTVPLHSYHAPIRESRAIASTPAIPDGAVAPTIGAIDDT